MLCMICKQKEARVHLTQMDQGKIKKVDLCEQCAKEKGVDDPAAFSLADLLMSMGAGTAQDVSSPTAVGPTCPGCGLTQGEFKKTGRLGCPECYSVFAQVLTGPLKSMHRGPRHIGKRPGVTSPTLGAEDHLAELQKQLSQAISVENYEEAARIRDQIRSLKNTGGAVLSA